MTTEDHSRAAAFLRGWAAQAAQEGIDGRTFLAAAQQQLRRMADHGIEADGKTLTQLQRSLSELEPEELKRHLELLAWAIEAIEKMRGDGGVPPEPGDN
jgi:hypothetical protein